MAKKSRVSMHCPVCKKSTVHEIRTLNGQEACICLLCKDTPPESENPELRQLNREIRAYDQANRMIERYRSWIIPGG